MESNISTEDRREKRLQNRRKWNLRSYHTQLAITNKHATNKTHAHKHLLEPTLLPTWAYLCSVKSNEADIKGQCGVCITLLGLRDEMSDRNPHGGREEGEERNTLGNNWFQLGYYEQRCLCEEDLELSFELWKKADINSWHRVCFKQNVDGIK